VGCRSENMFIPRELVVRSLYSDPPPAQNAIQVNPTLLVSWWCTGFALVIIIVRLSGRYIRTEKLFMEDKIMACSIIPLLARMAFVHLVLKWGTNNAVTTGLSPEDIWHRELGSKMVLPARICYAALSVSPEQPLGFTPNMTSLASGLQSSQSPSSSNASTQECGKDHIRSPSK